MKWFWFSCFIAVEDGADDPDAAGDVCGALAAAGLTTTEEWIEPAQGPSRVVIKVVERSDPRNGLPIKDCS